MGAKRPECLQPFRRRHYGRRATSVEPVRVSESKGGLERVPLGQVKDKTRSTGKGGDDGTKGPDLTEATEATKKRASPKRQRWRRRCHR
jgi:hypothetical protein